MRLRRIRSASSIPDTKHLFCFVCRCKFLELVIASIKNSHIPHHRFHCGFKQPWINFIEYVRHSIEYIRLQSGEPISKLFASSKALRSSIFAQCATLDYGSRLPSGMLIHGQQQRARRHGGPSGGRRPCNDLERVCAGATRYLPVFNCETCRMEPTKSGSLSLQSGLHTTALRTSWDTYSL